MNEMFRKPRGKGGTIMQRRQLQYFIEVVDCCSISAAAQKLFVAQPSLSRTINALEKEMGCELLERTSKGGAPHTDRAANVLLCPVHFG